MYSISYKSLDNYTIPVLDTFKKFHKYWWEFQKMNVDFCSIKEEK